MVGGAVSEALDVMVISFMLKTLMDVAVRTYNKSRGGFRRSYNDNGSASSTGYRYS